MDKCIVCDNMQFEGIFNNILLKCRICGFVTANINISEEELIKVYGQDYFNGEEYGNYLEDKHIIQKNFKYRLRQIERFTKGNNSPNIMEIGCAYGFFGELIKKHYPTADYVGFDIAENAVEYAKSTLKLNVENKNYLNALPPFNPFSHVFMWDVIEHLPNPNAFMEKISKESVIGSYLFITTGNISSFIPRLRGVKWRMIHPPTHLHYFSDKTIKKLLKKHGYEVQEITHPPVSRSMKQIFYSYFMLRKKVRPWKTYIYEKIPPFLFLKINTFDIMFVVAKKVRGSG